MKKGFTLIELLAVIVILAIIALIATPLIINIIDDAKKGSFKNTAYGIKKAAELRYTQDILDGSATKGYFTYEDGVETSSVEGKVLNYTGEKPESGNVAINEEGKVAIAVFNGEYCAEKDYNDSEVVLTTKTKEECKLDLNDFIQFQNHFGGTSYDNPYRAVKVSDGYLITGMSDSNDGNLTGLNNGVEDAFLIKYDEQGNLLWNRNYGGSEWDDIYHAAEINGYYITVGNSCSSDGDLTGLNIGACDAIVVKYDTAGNIISKENYGGSDNDQFSYIKKLEDGYIITGYTGSADGDLIINGEEGHAVTIKYDMNGNVLWHKIFGGSGSEGFAQILPVADGYVMIGDSMSSDGDLTGLNNGDRDGIIVKYDMDGNVLWKKNFGGSGRDLFRGVVKTSDGYIVSGSSNSTDGDLTGLNNGDYDGIIVKYDLSGNLVWSKNYGGSGRDSYGNLVNHSDVCTVMGTTDSTDGDLTGLNKGNRDVMIVRYDNNGNVLSKENLGGSGYDMSGFITEVGNSYIITGSTTSNDGIFDGLNIGGTDAYIIKR